MSELVGKGVYSVPEAARFARVHSRTVRRWVTGAQKKGEAVLASDIPPVGNRSALSFLDLIDLLVVGRLRDAGVALQTVRRVYRTLQDSLESKHPFSHHRLLTDGKTVFLESLDGVGASHLQEVLSGQLAMPRVLRPYLKQIEYGEKTQTAVRWHISRGVIIDPARSFGQPVLAKQGTSTYVLSAAFHANNRNASLVAELFDVPVDGVRNAVEFERQYGRARAA